jgi:hypothetical protein
MWNLVSVYWKNVLVPVQDSYTVWAQSSIGSEIVLEIVLILTQDRSTVCAEHTIGSEIILDAPDGAPR